MEVTVAESEAFEAQVAISEGDYERADALAYRAMLLAARALLRSKLPNIGDDPNEIVDAFRTHFYDTRLFFDRFAKGKFARYLFDRHENGNENLNPDRATAVVEEAQLFIEAAHACDLRINGEAAEQPKVPATPPAARARRRSHPAIDLGNEETNLN